MMDINTLRSLVTVIGLILFLWIVWRTFNRKNKAYFNKSAAAALADCDQDALGRHFDGKSV